MITPLHESVISFAEFTELPLTYVHGMQGSKGAHRVYRNDDVGLQVEVVTAKTKSGGWAKGQRYYFLDGDERQFETALDCYNAYRGKHGLEPVDLNPSGVANPGVAPA